jgi:hypothetical protein
MSEIDDLRRRFMDPEAKAELERSERDAERARREEAAAKARERRLEDRDDFKSRRPEPRQAIRVDPDGKADPETEQLIKRLKDLEIVCDPVVVAHFRGLCKAWKRWKESTSYNHDADRSTRGLTLGDLWLLVEGHTPADEVSAEALAASLGSDQLKRGDEILDITSSWELGDVVSFKGEAIRTGKTVDAKSGHRGPEWAILEPSSDQFVTIVDWDGKLHGHDDGVVLSVRGELDFRTNRRIRGKKAWGVHRPKWGIIS